MNRLQYFLEIFKQGLINVNESYYSIERWGNVNNLPENTNFERYLERVFCYELYHQVRRIMDISEQILPNIFRDVSFNGELRKEIIQVILLPQNILPLEARYMPDFLLHSPGNFDNQLLIVEVKTNPELTYAQIQDDLLKIEQFIKNYKYKQGIFLITNNDYNRIIDLLNSPIVLNWIDLKIINKDKIKVLLKKSTDDIFEFSLNEIPISREIT